MPKGIPTDPSLKAEIIKTIREEGISSYKASQIYGIPVRTINNWLDNATKGSEKNYIAQINQLKKKLDNAYRVIGKLTAEVERPKGWAS